MLYLSYTRWMLQRHYGNVKFRHPRDTTEISHRCQLKSEDPMTINTNIWELYEVYQTYHEAFCMIGFAKNQGYAGSLMRELSDGRYAVYTLKMVKGATLNG